MNFTVIGTPAPQGSKKHVGHGVMVESSKKVKPWREAVAHAAFEARRGAPPMDGPLALTVTFFLPRPASLTKRRIAEGPCRKPDLDKLVRSTIDALTTSGLIVDDARIVKVVAEKRYVDDLIPQGADISIWELA